MKIFKKRKLSEEIEKYDNYRLAEVLELKDDIQPVADVAQADAFKSIKKLDKRAKEAFKEVEKNVEPVVKSTHNRTLGIVDKTDAMKKMGLVESFNKKFPSVDYSISHKNKDRFLKVYTESLNQAKSISTWASGNKIPCYIKKSKGVYSCVLKEEWVDEDACHAGIAQDLNYLIKDELEAVDGYNSVLATWRDADKFPEVIAVLKDIVDEEMLHIGQLQRALELVSPNAKNIQAGAKEAEEQIVDEAEKQKEKEIEKAEEKFRDKIDVEVEDSIEDIEDGEKEVVDIDVVEESKKCKTKKLSEDLEKEGIQYFGTKNQYNYDKMQLRIDHDNKTYQLGAFTHISKRETVSTPELKRIIERLKELGYKEIKKDNLKEETELSIFTQIPEEELYDEADYILDNDYLYGENFTDGIIIDGKRDFTSKIYSKYHRNEILDLLNNGYSTNEIVQNLNKITGKKYTYRQISGYNQSDWANLYYPEGEFKNEFLDVLADAYFGNYTAYDGGDNGVVVVFDSDSRPVKKIISEETGIPENQIKIRKFDGYIRTPKYIDEKVNKPLKSKRKLEDVEKLPNGKWANVGKDGKADSGTFKTKKEAEAQMRAMYANGYKESVKREGMKDTLDAYVKGETLEERYEPYSSFKTFEYKDKTEQGYDVIKIFRDLDDDRVHIIFHRAKPEDYNIGLGYSLDDGVWNQGRYNFNSVEDAEKSLKGKYNVEDITDTFKEKKIKVKEDLEEEQETDKSTISIEEKFKMLKEYPTYKTFNSKRYYTRPVKIYDLGLTPEQKEKFEYFLQDGLDYFWRNNEELAKDIYQEGRMGGHLVLDIKVLDPEDYINFDNYQKYVKNYLENNYYPDGDDGEYLQYQIDDAKKEVDSEISLAYDKLMDFDDRVNKLIEKLKETLDNFDIDSDNMDESLKKDLKEEKIEKGPFQVIWYVMEDDHPRCECFKEKEKAIEYCNKHKEDKDKLEMQAVEVNDKDEIVDYLVL